MHANRHGRPLSPALKVAAQMPLLDHYHPGRPFDIMESDCVAWLVAQPEIRQEVWNWLKHHRAIVFEDGKWRGAEFYASGRLNE